MDIITKDFPVTTGDATDEYPNGTFEVILSAPTLDRDGEVVDSKAFEPLPGHITFDTDHSMTCDSVVGSGVPSYAEDGTLRVKGGYASDERSQVIRRKVAEGHIRTTSVTFMAAERISDAKGIDHVVKAELLNGTFTPVPSNRESVVLTAKSIVEHEAAATFKATSKEKASIQDVHDVMVGLGAACEGKAHAAEDTKTPDEPAEVEPVEAEDVDDALTEPSADTTTDDAAAVEAAAESAEVPADDEEAKALAHAIENAAHFAFGG